MDNGGAQARVAEQDRRIVNFLRDRDAYHVPAALHAAGRLSALVTDLYYDRVPPVLRFGPVARLSDHRSDRLAGARIVGSGLATAMQAFDRLSHFSGRDLSFHVDAVLGRRTLALWRSAPTSLLLYSGYAEHTFAGVAGSGFTRGLFLFHPHHRLVSEILREDAARHPTLRAAFERDGELRQTWRHRRADAELAMADHVVTASTFSALSARHARPDVPVAVAPYFTDTPANPAPDASRSKGSIGFLFVGQGVQRKGLHHLFLAWRKAGLTSATLTCVCSRLEPAIAAMAPEGVIFKRGLSSAELIAEYDRASVFVMPSLIEGFGLVYLEAAKRGAVVIATPNTGAPDMDLVQGAIALARPGDVEDLARLLQAEHARAAAGQVDREAITASAEAYDFRAYADRLNAAVDGR